MQVETVTNGGTVIGNAAEVHVQTANVYTAGMESSVADYYIQLAADCKLHTVHAAIGDDAPPGVSPRTAQVYVTPDVWIAEKASKKSKPDGVELETRKRVPLTDCLASTETSVQRIVLTASSGMGKTTTVNMQVVKLAKTGSAPWMVLRLPALLGLDFSGAKLVEKALERDIQLKLTKSAVDAATIARELIKRLDAKSGVMLFDALDEVPAEERQRVVSSVSEFLDDRNEAQSGHRVVLTSRPYVYQGDSLTQLANKGFTRVELAPFTPDQRNKLIDQYFSKVVDRQEIGDAMKRQVAKVVNGDIAALLEEPMLLTYACMLAAVSADGVTGDGSKADAPLPSTRYKLFDGLVTLMLEKWDSSREVDQVSAFRPMFERANGRSPLRSLLERAAYWQVTQRRLLHDKIFRSIGRSFGMISHEKLVAFTDDAMPATMPVRANEIVRWLVQRSGLVVRAQEGTQAGYQLHKQLLFFLAAGQLRALSEDDQEFARRLVETLWPDPEWFRQLISMGLARLAESPTALTAAVDFVTAIPDDYLLQPKVVGRPRYEEAIAVFAIAWREAVRPATSDSTRLMQPAMKRLRMPLLELIESQRLPVALRAEAADALGAFGDPRFEKDRPYRWRRPIHDAAREPIPGFVQVPAGPFFLGEHESAAASTRNANIRNAFYIARTLTTVEQYADFVNDKGYERCVAIWTRQGLDWLSGQFDSTVRSEGYARLLRQRPPDLRTTPADWAAQCAYPSRPVTGVTWFEARAYARWLSAKMRAEIDSLPALRNYGVTLPTEDQWERAARAITLTSAGACRWPWRSSRQKDVPQRANVNTTGIGHVTTVGVFAPNPIGLFDMAGNAWQWMDNLSSDSSADGFVRVAPERELRNDADLGKCDLPSLRGGSWSSPAELASCAFRNRSHPGASQDSVGFRVVLSLAEKSVA